MFLTKKKRNMGGIPTSSMSDVAFLLLIFFLSTTKFDIKKGLGLVLPQASTEDTQKVVIKNDNMTKIMVDKDGNIAINEKIVPFEQVKPTVKALVKSNSKMVFSLKTDRQSHYGNMVKVLDQLRLAGAEKINLSTN